MNKYLVMFTNWLALLLLFILDKLLGSIYSMETLTKVSTRLATLLIYLIIILAGIYLLVGILYVLGIILLLNVHIM